jgi:hypothetical protein
LAEDWLALAFRGSPAQPEWLEEAEAEALFAATPDGNVDSAVAEQRLGQVLADYEAWAPHLEEAAENRAEELLASHERVRTAGGSRRIPDQVRPQLPVDVLGVYVYLPAAV